MKKSLSKAYDKRAFLFTCFFMIWVGFAYFFVQTISFESNDDNSMARMAYGMIGQYETHLVFINVFVGQCLKLCLQLFPNVPWYTVFQCALVLSSFAVIVYLIVDKLGIKRGILPCILLIFFFGPQYFLKLQFTKTAGICAMAGLLMLFHAVRADKPWRILKYVIGILLAVAGSMYRFNVFGMILICMFGLGLVLVWEPLKQRNWKELVRVCLPFVIVIGLCFLFKFYDNWSYQSDPVWAAYREFNSLRAKLMDYGFPDYATNEALYTSLGISMEDLEMFQSWDFADTEVFTVDAMRQLIAAKPEQLFSKKAFLTAIIEFFLDYRYSVAVLIALVIAVLTLKKDKTFFFAYLLLAIVAIQGYLVYKGRYGVNRIDVSLACAMFVLLILYVWDSITDPPKWLAGILAVVLLLSPLGEYDYMNPQDNGAKAEPVPFYELMAMDTEHLYVRTVSTSVPRIPRPLEIYPQGYQSNSCALGGWGTKTGSYLEVWEKYGVTNLFRDIVDNPNLYLVATSGVESRIAYIQRHYAPDAQAYLVKITEDGYPIYRVCTDPEPDVDTSQAICATGMEKMQCSFYMNGMEGGGMAFNGLIYAEGENSYTSNVYVGVTNWYGKETLYYAVQSHINSLESLTSGRYAAYYCEAPYFNTSFSVRIYLETDDALYYIPAYN